MTLTVKTKREKVDGLVLLPTILVERMKGEYKSETCIQFGFMHKIYEVTFIKKFGA